MIFVVLQQINNNFIEEPEVTYRLREFPQGYKLYNAHTETWMNGIKIDERDDPYLFGKDNALPSRWQSDSSSIPQGSTSKRCKRFRSPAVWSRFSM